MKKYVSVLVLVLIFNSLSAQFKIEEVRPDVAQKHKIDINPVRSEVLAIPLSQEIVGLPPSVEEEWIDPDFYPNPSFREIPPGVLQKTQEKLNNLKDFYPDEAGGSRTVAPNIGYNYEGNVYGTLRPPDNDIAVSSSGIVVSVTNSRINYYNSTGTLTYTNSFAALFGQYSFTLYDPKILYDPNAHRFIMVVLEGTSPSHTIVKLCFSKSSDPSSGWWVYSLDGDINNGNNWFDFPNIGTSIEDVFVTGNLFNSSNSFQTAALYQLDKSDGYAGASMNYITWHGLANSPFTLVPARYGQSGNYGPGTYMVASDGSNDQIRLYRITADIGNSPTINAYSVAHTIDYAGNAPQLGTATLLDNGYYRIRSAFYLNGIVHFVLGCERGTTNYNGIRYCRLTVSPLTIWSNTFGADGYDYSYPSIASYGGTSSTNKAVTISFLRSSSTIYPEQRVVHVDDGGTFSGSVQVKGGETYIRVNPSGGVERWGDYSGIARKPSSTPEVWVAGCYGKAVGGSAHAYGTWIAQVKNVTQPDLLVQSQNASPTSIEAGNTTYINCSVINQGNASSGSSYVGYYLSTNTTWGAADVFLTSDYVPGLGLGGSSAESATVTIPASTTAGTYYILYRADYTNTNTESNESNNVSYKQITVTPALPDLIVQSQNASPTTIEAGNTTYITCTVKNQGNGSAGYSYVGY